jgi:hypothetical protein
MPVKRTPFRERGSGPTPAAARCAKGDVGKLEATGLRLTRSPVYPPPTPAQMRGKPKLGPLARKTCVAHQQRLVERRVQRSATRKGPQMADEATICLGCGGSMPPRPGISVCSPTCRLREWRARRRRSRRASCADCGQVFVPRRSDTRYCGLSCKERAHRRRRKAAAGEPQMAAGGLSASPGPPGATSSAFEKRLGASS